MIELPQLTPGGLDRPTAADTVPPPQGPPATAELIMHPAAPWRGAGVLDVEATSLSGALLRWQLTERTARRERESVKDLLEVLSGRGLSWSLLARMLHVSVPAIRKWRLGGGATPQNRRELARIVALLDMLEKDVRVEDPAAWLEIPLGSTTRTLADAYAADRLDLILDYAARRIRSPEELLDELDPGWRRAAAAREFEVFLAADGDLAIRRIPGR